MAAWGGNDNEPRHVFSILPKRHDGSCVFARSMPPLAAWVAGIAVLRFSRTIPSQASVEEGINVSGSRASRCPVSAFCGKLTEGCCANSSLPTSRCVERQADELLTGTSTSQKETQSDEAIRRKLYHDLGTEPVTPVSVLVTNDPDGDYPAERCHHYLLLTPYFV